MFLQIFANQYLKSYILYCILVFEPQNDSSFDITYCRALIQMSENGLGAFFCVNAQRFTNTQLQQLSTFATPDVCFDDIYIDLVGSLPPSNCYSYILTSIDCFTRWVEPIPIVDITAQTVTRAFISGWISRFGTLSTITTDHESQFESGLCKQLMELLRTSHLHTISYHPIANGLVEKFHCQLKATLKSQLHPDR